MRVDVIPTADAATPEGLRGRRVLMVDVLRASTTIVAAFAHGCRDVIPVADAAEAWRRARALGAGALLVGERRGQTLPGFDLGNSPIEVSTPRVRGRSLILTTSNGTRALLRARAAAAVAIAGFVNAGAAAAWALETGGDVTVLCAGERAARSLEDHVCAGLIVERLARGDPRGILEPRAREARAVAAPYGTDVGRLGEDSSWARHLAASGRAADVAASLALDASALVPLYLSDIDKVVLGPR